MGHAKLTLQIVESAPVGAVDLFIWDARVKGFAVRVQPGGARTYIVQYRFAGQTRRYKIGRHGSPWTVEKARERALEVLGRVASGEDPQVTKLADRSAMTLSELCDLYLQEGLITRKPKSVEAARNRIENHIKPLLGSKRAALVTCEDVEKLLRAVAEGRTARLRKTKKQGLSRVRGGRGAANTTVVTLSAVFGFGVRRGVRADNPAWRVRRFPEKKLARFLSPAELGRLGEAIAAAEALGVENAYALAAIKLLVLTGCRKSEILTAKLAYVDHFHSCLRLPDSKTGTKVVHLGAAALKVIEALPPMPGNPFLLPGAGGAGHLVNIQKAWSRLRAAADLQDVRLHDLRHSFASVGVTSGSSLLVVGALLGHQSPKTTHRYAHLADHPVKAAADAIANQLAALLRAETADPRLTKDAHIPAWRVGDAAAGERALSVLGELRRARWLDTRAAAAFLGHAASTLETWRWAGLGPAYRKIGRRVVYAQVDLEDWARREGAHPSAVADGGIPRAPNVVRLDERRGRARH